MSESNTVLDSGFHAVNSGSHSLSVELGFWIVIVSGIPDSPSCIPDSKAWHLQILQTKSSRIQDMDSSSTNFRDFGNRMVRYGATSLSSSYNSQ